MAEALDAYLPETDSDNESLFSSRRFDASQKNVAKNELIMTKDRFATYINQSVPDRSHSNYGVPETRESQGPPHVAENRFLIQSEAPRTERRPILGRGNSDQKSTGKKSSVQARMEAARNDSSLKFSRSKRLAENPGMIEVVNNAKFPVVDVREKDKMAALAAAQKAELQAQLQAQLLEQKKMYLRKSLEETKNDNMLMEKKLIDLSLQ